MLDYFQNSTLEADKWYDFVRIGKSNADLVFEAVSYLVNKQPLRYIGLEFEISADYSKFRAKKYYTETLYKLSSKDEIQDGLVLAASLGFDISKFNFVFK